MDVPIAPLDRFIPYKMWQHDRSVVYHLATWTNVAAWLTNFLVPSLKVTVIFLKVQLPEPGAAFDALRREGIDLGDKARAGLDDDVATELGQKLQPWNSVAGDALLAFCDRNVDRLAVGVQEVGYFRIVTVVWAPRAGDSPRMAGMRDFITNHWAWKKEAQVEAVARVPIRIIVGAALGTS